MSELSRRGEGCTGGEKLWGNIVRAKEVFLRDVDCRAAVELFEWVLSYLFQGSLLWNVDPSVS